MSRPTDILNTDGTVDVLPYATPCPYCGRPNNSAVYAGNTESATPNDGDVAISAYTAQEEAAVLADPQVRRVIASMRAHESRGPSLAARVARTMGPTP